MLSYRARWVCALESSSFLFASGRRKMTFLADIHGAGMWLAQQHDRGSILV